MRRALLMSSLLAAAGAAGADPPRYEVRRNHDPNGTGKFYLGREIAQVMGYQAAGWLDRREREKEEDPAKLLAALELKPGMVVADVGAGSGYHTFRIAPVVAPDGKVLAVDVQPQMVKLLKDRAAQKKLTNVEAIQGAEADPKLPPGGVDVVLMVDVYHELAQPFEMGEKLVAALKPGGRLVFVEFRLEDDAVPIKAVHKMSERQVLKEMAAFPELEHAKTVGTLPWQHVVIFTKKEGK